MECLCNIRLPIRYWNQSASIANRNKIHVLRFDSQTCGNNPTINGACDISTEQWHHLVLRKTANVMSFFQDGILSESVTDNTSNSSCSVKNNNPVFIGKRDQDARYFTGNIDDVIFYNRSLTESEIAQLYHSNGWIGPQNEDLQILSYAIPDQISVDIDENDRTVHVLLNAGPTLKIRRHHSLYQMALQHLLMVRNR